MDNQVLIAFAREYMLLLLLRQKLNVVIEMSASPNTSIHSKGTRDQALYASCVLCVALIFLV